MLDVTWLASAVIARGPDAMRLEAGTRESACRCWQVPAPPLPALSAFAKKNRLFAAVILSVANASNLLVVSSSKCVSYTLGTFV